MGRSSRLMSGPNVCHKPNFFILGAGKCGTTSLFNSLRQHPEIFLPSMKEPTFFCDQFQVVTNPVDYFRLFDSVLQEKAVGEASHAYMTNPSSARVLQALFPEARFVVILRNPVDRAYSLYHHMRRTGFEKASSFEKALQAEEKRVRSPSFPKKCRHYYCNYLYFRSGLFGAQIERFFALFDPAQFHFLTLDQFRAEPGVSLRQIFSFLDVNTDFQPELSMQNPGKTLRAPLLMRPLAGSRLLRRFPGLAAFGLRLLEKILLKQIPPMQPDTRQQLQLSYRGDLQKIYHLTGLSLNDDCPARTTIRNTSTPGSDSSAADQA